MAEVSQRAAIPSYLEASFRHRRACDDRVTMGLGLTITSANRSTPDLGTSKDLSEILSSHFSGFRPVIELNRSAPGAAAAFLRSVLPRGLKWSMVGPTTATINVAHVDEDGYAIEFQYDEGPCVAVLYLTLYGQTAAAEGKLAAICAKERWTKSYD